MPMADLDLKAQFFPNLLVNFLRLSSRDSKPYYGIKYPVFQMDFGHQSYYLIDSETGKHNLLRAIQFLKIP